MELGRDSLIPFELWREIWNILKGEMLNFWRVSIWVFQQKYVITPKVSKYVTFWWEMLMQLSQKLKIVPDRMSL